MGKEFEKSFYHNPKNRVLNYLFECAYLPFGPETKKLKQLLALTPIIYRLKRKEPLSNWKERAAILADSLIVSDEHFNNYLKFVTGPSRLQDWYDHTCWYTASKATKEHYLASIDVDLVLLARVAWRAIDLKCFTPELKLIWEFQASKRHWHTLPVFSSMKYEDCAYWHPTAASEKRATQLLLFRKALSVNEGHIHDRDIYQLHTRFDPVGVMNDHYVRSTPEWINYAHCCQHMSENPNDFEAFVCYYHALAGLHAIDISKVDLLGLWETVHKQKGNPGDQAESLYERLYGLLAERLTAALRNVMVPLLILPMVASLVTAICSIVSIWKDGSIAAGTVGLVASLTAFIYTSSCCVWGPTLATQKLGCTQEKIAAKLADIFHYLWTKPTDKKTQEEIAEEILTNNAEETRRQWQRPIDETAELPILGVEIEDEELPPRPYPRRRSFHARGKEIREAATMLDSPVSDDKFQACEDMVDIVFGKTTTAQLHERQVDELEEELEAVFQTEDQAHTDVVKLGLSVAALLTGVGFAIAGGQSCRNASNIAKTVAGFGSLGITASSIYTLTAGLFTDDGAERKASIGNDIHLLSVDIANFMKKDASFLTVDTLQQSWDAMSDRFYILNKMCVDERDSIISNHFRDLQFAYYKASEKYKAIHEGMIGVRTRVEPVFVNFYGTPGAGKSTFVQTTLKPYLCGIMDTSMHTGCIEFSGKQKYAPAFQGKPIAIMDEYMQGNPEDDDIQTITNMISSMPYKCDGASVELKNQYFTAEMVVTLSNRGTFNIHNATCPAETVAAFWSRHNFFYCVRDGQEVDAGRNITPGSKLRLFHSNGHTPTAAELEIFQEERAGVKYWIVPKELPPWLIREYTLREMITWITARLVKHQNQFRKMLEEQQRIYDAIKPDQKLVQRPNLPADFGLKFPKDSMFTADHPMRKKVDEIFERILERNEEAEFPLHAEEIVIRKSHEQIVIDANSIQNEIPNHTPAKPKPAGKPTPPFPRPLTEEERAQLQKEAVDNFKEMKSNFPQPGTSKGNKGGTPKRSNRLAKALDETQHQMATSPLVLHACGNTNTGKSFTWNRWMEDMAFLYNMNYHNTKGAVPTVAAPNTVYILDDVIPNNYEAYCQFWEKCDGSNIICLTSNMPMPKPLGLPSKMYYGAGFSGKAALVSQQVLDCTSFPSEKLIRRAGVGGHILYADHVYHVGQESSLFHQISHGQVVYNNVHYSDVNIKPLLSQKFAEHLNKEIAVDWLQTDQEPPVGMTFDLEITLDPKTMHTITAQDFIEAASIRNKKVKLNFVTSPSTWRDPAVFVTNSLIPHVMPREKEAWVQREAFSGIIKALLPQRKEFKLKIKFGDNYIYTIGDDVVRVRIADSVNSIIRIDDVNELVYVEHPWNDYSDVVSFDSVVLLLGVQPSHRAAIPDPETRKVLINNKANFLKHKFFRTKLANLDRMRYYEDLRQRAAKETANMAQWFRDHPIVSVVVGSLVAVAAVYAGAKLLSHVLSGEAHCESEDCKRDHVQLQHLQVSGKTYHSVQEAAANWQYSPLVPNSVRWYTSEEPKTYYGWSHDDPNMPFRKNAPHEHLCPKGHWFMHQHESKAAHTDADCPYCHPDTEHQYGWAYGKPSKGRKGKYQDYPGDTARPQKDKFSHAGSSKFGSSQLKSYHDYETDDKPFVAGPKQYFGVSTTDSSWAATAANINWAEDEMYTFEAPIIASTIHQSIEQLKAKLPKAIDGIEKKVMSNLVVVRHGIHSVKGLMLRDGFGVTVEHIASVGEEIEIESDQWTGKALVMYSYEDRDIAYFQIQGINTKPWKDITKYFAPASVVEKPGTVRAYYIRNEGLVATQAPATLLKTFSYPTVNGEVTQSQRMQIQYMSRDEIVSLPGDCGTPFFVTDPRLSAAPICALHCTIQRQFCRSVAVAITREDIEQVLAVHYQTENEEGEIFYDAVEEIDEIIKPNELGMELFADQLTKNVIKNLEPGTHDLGEPTRLFPIGYSPTMFSPAGFRKPSHDPTPWGAEITEKTGLISDQAPAASWPSQMDPTAVAELQKDRRGKPSIIATRMLSANNPNAPPLPEIPRDQTIQELADFYYPKIAKFDGFRPLNTHEIINGVHCASDPLRGIMGMEPGSSPGIYYLKFFHIMRKGDLFEGPEGQKTFAKTPAGENLRQRYQIANLLATRGQTLIDLSNVKLKSELRPIEKVAQGQTRAFESEGILSNMMLKKAFGGMFEAMAKSRHSLHAAVGMDPGTEAAMYYDRLIQFSKVFGRDHKQFDKSVLEQILVSVCKIFIIMYMRAETEGLYNSNVRAEMRVKAAFAYIIYSVENIEGTIAVTRGIVNSGIFGTSLIDSICIDFTTTFCTKMIIGKAIVAEKILNPFEHEIVHGFPTLRSIHSHQTWIDCGDDNLTSCDEEYGKVINYKTIKAALYDYFRIRCTPPEKDSDDYEFGTIRSESFCSRYFIGRYPFITWALKKSSIERQLFWTTNAGPEEIYNQMIFGVLPEAARWQDEAYYNKIRAAVRIVLKYLEMDDDTVSYQVEIAKLHQDLGLAQTLSSGSDSLIKAEFDKILIENRKNFENFHNTTMSEIKCICGMVCNSQVAKLKHWANSHAKDFVPAECTLCDRTLDADEWKTHDHPSVPCKIAGCVAKPKNLANMCYHAQSHSKTIKECFGAVTEHQQSTGTDAYLVECGRKLHKIHLDQAAKICGGLAKAIKILHKTDEFIGEAAYDIPNLGIRRLARTTSGDLGFFSMTFDSEWTKAYEVMETMVPEGFIIYHAKDGIWITADTEHQMASMQFGAPAVSNMVGAMYPVGIASNLGASEAVAMKSPPGIIDAQNTVAATVNLNSLGADPSMMEIAGRTDTLAQVATQQKQLLKVIQMTTTTEANSLLARIRYGACSGRIAQWMKLHDYYAGSFLYEISMLGNGALTGSIVCGWYAGTAGENPPTPAQSTFNDVNWCTLAVNAGASATFQLNDVRDEGFVRHTRNEVWSPETGVKNYGAELLVYVGDKLVNPMGGGETSITIRIYVKTGPDFKVAKPLNYTEKNPVLSKSLPNNEAFALSDYFGSKAYITTDNPYPSALPAAGSVFQKRINTLAIPIGAAGIMEQIVRNRNVQLSVPKFEGFPDQWLRFCFGNMKSGFPEYNYPRDLMVQTGPSSNKYAFIMRGAISGEVDTVATFPLDATLRGNKYALDDKEMDNAPFERFADEVGQVLDTRPYMLTPGKLVGGEQISIVTNYDDSCGHISAVWETIFGTDIYTDKWKEIKEQWEPLVPNTVFSSYNYDLSPVGRSSNAVLLTISSLPAPAVDESAPRTTVATFPTKTTYNWLDRLRSLANHQDMVFDIVDIQTNNVVANCCYDWVTGVVYTTRRTDMPIWNLCTLTDMSRLVCTNFLPTTQGTVPTPVKADIFVPRIIHTTREGYKNYLHHMDVRKRLPGHTHRINPVFDDEDEEDDIDNNCLNTENQSGTDEWFTEKELAETMTGRWEDHTHTLAKRFVEKTGQQKYSINFWENILMKMFYAFTRNELDKLHHYGRDPYFRRHQRAFESFVETLGVPTWISENVALCDIRGHKNCLLIGDDIHHETDKGIEIKNKKGETDLIPDYRGILSVPPKLAEKMVREFIRDNPRYQIDETEHQSLTFPRPLSYRDKLAGKQLELNTMQTRAGIIRDKSHHTIEEKRLEQSAQRLQLDAITQGENNSIKADALEHTKNIDTARLGLEQKKIDNSTTLAQVSAANDTARVGLEKNKLSLAEQNAAAQTSLARDRLAFDMKKHSDIMKTPAAAPQMAGAGVSGSVIAGGAAIGQGVGGIIGGIGGIIMADREMDNREDETNIKRGMAKDQMQMQENAAIADRNNLILNNAANRAQALHGLSGVQSTMKNQFQLDAALGTPNYESNV